jgi:hypothetical protein
MAEKQDFSVKYGGRGFMFQIIVNTDEDQTEIIRRLLTAAGGVNMNAVVIGMQNLMPGELKNILKAAQTAADSGEGNPITRA